MEKTTIYLPIALKNEIRDLARSSKRSEAEIIRHALSQYVEQTRTERPMPKSLGMVSDGSFDAVDYETHMAESWKPDWQRSATLRYWLKLTPGKLTLNRSRTLSYGNLVRLLRGVDPDRPIVWRQ